MINLKNCLLLKFQVTVITELGLIQAHSNKIPRPRRQRVASRRKQWTATINNLLGLIYTIIISIITGRDIKRGITRLYRMM